MAERDHALFDSERLRGEAARSAAGFKEERARAESEAAARASLEQQLSASREQSHQQRQELDAQSAECEEARRKLRQGAEERRRLEAAAATTQVCAGAKHLYHVGSLHSQVVYICSCVPHVRGSSPPLCTLEGRERRG